MDELFRVLGQLTLIVGAAWGLLLFVGRKWIDHHFSVLHERAKTQLAREAEEWRAAISRVSFEHQTRFSRLQDRSFAIVAEVYARLVRVEHSAQQLTSSLIYEGAPTEEQRYANTCNAFNDFVTYFSEHAIFLDESTCTILDDFSGEIRIALADFSTRRSLEGAERHEQWTSAYRRVIGTIPGVKTRLEADLRERLGVAKPKPLVTTQGS